jgi:hypothetical protein
MSERLRRLAALVGIALAVAIVIIAFMLAMGRYTARPDDWVAVGLGAGAYTVLVLYLMWPIPLRRMHGLRRARLVLLAEAPVLALVALVWRGTLLTPKSPWLYIAVAIVVGAVIGTLGLAWQSGHDAKRRRARPARK